MDEFKLAARPLNGGYKCPCCGPVGGDEKRKFRRQARARLSLSDRFRWSNECDESTDIIRSDISNN